MKNESNQPNNLKPPNDRKPYEKPVLRRFPLVAEEVLAAGCKMASFPSGGFQGFNCAVTGCSTVNGS
ncbi:MAG: hypothetical protein GKR94_01710 [Gammaproteobacteria bacterium]|nr:hypothetical protein [Gammaproteobacteria bacterium]